ncbi:hypothetical protein MTR67_005986 [Solanum verrucosum]|uniref:Uncharacterized protein n=1 Tax=Solanum verrucosum TaxID=315347 RepID=A0AAF0PXA4_SOLVR|nr:hypothetical protein MTR67_005986 [Solanum verrucosum]
MVKEAVYYSAELQLPNTMPKSEKKQIADMTTMKEMGLQDAMETRIGGWSGKGISGGQKRRGRTIIASIHQPSTEVFSLFHSLCLLSCVYFGPASAATEEGEVLEKRSRASFATQSLVLTKRSFVNDFGYYWLHALRNTSIYDRFFRSPNDLPIRYSPLHYVAFHRYAYEGMFKNEFEGLKIHDEHMKGEDILRNTWQMDMDYSKWIDLAILLGMLVTCIQAIVCKGW